MTGTRDAENHHLVGGVLCLDFTNTLYGHQEPIHEYLIDYRDLVLWSRHATLIAPERAASLLANWENAPDGFEEVFNHAIRVRETIYRIFSSLAKGRTPQIADIQELHRSWVESQAHSRLLRDKTGFVLGWEQGEARDAMLWPIIDSAVALLTSTNLERVKQCARCDWLFLDMSRNRSRRWCSMSACGNRVKMARRYRRTRQAGTAQDT